MKHILQNNITFFIALLLCINTAFPQSGWIIQDPLPQLNTLYGVCFLDADKWISVGDSGTILISTNKGFTWTKKESGTTNRLTAVTFTDQNTGTIVGREGTILRTTNGGASWTSQSSGTNYNIYAVSFTNANTGIATGSPGMVLTENGGSVWYERTSFINRDLASWTLWGVSIKDSQIVAVGQGSQSVVTPPYIAMRSSIIMYSSDRGNNWNSIRQTFPSILDGVYLIDANIGTIVGTSGTIYRTVNGGASWTIQSSGTTNNLLFVSFTDANVGTIVGVSGTILRTTNGGASWTSQSSGTTNSLNAVSFIDANTGIAVGQDGIILRTTTGGTTGIKDISNSLNQIPSQYILEQNYPNPFNPNTVILFNLPIKSFVKLIIFDIMGKEVATLVNGELSAGSYSREWIGSNMSSGVYFYRLQVGSFTETKKLILVK